ncbi:MAG: response regulator transcription factor [Saprospiraceae bacterium]|nr:response regulator transcription factor [Saprospiraceae bacterium]MBK7738262.1 response regulator transcription factor [Saprospiraceae bacterium]MBK7913164.1 response regulator transcription factor [Saprospiraceae bacterium]
MSVKIILADDHHLVRQGFRSLLSGHAGFEILAEAANGKELIALLDRGLQPDIVLMDVEMPELNGIEACRILNRDHPAIRVLMISMLNDKDVIQEAVDAGAKAYLFKNTSIEELSQAIQQVMNGSNYFGKEIALAMLGKSKKEDAFALSQLSDREIEILKLIAEGFSSTEIGSKLFISPRTVDTHRNNLIQKLKVNGIAGLIRLAIQNKII